MFADKVYVYYLVQYLLGINTNSKGLSLSQHNNCGLRHCHKP